MKVEDAQILATLAIAPVSVVVSIGLWDPASPGVAFIPPIVGSVIAVITALEQKKARKLTWFVLAAQVAVMAMLVWAAS